MWNIPRLYVSACSNSCQLVPFQPIAISTLFLHYKELLECEKQIKELMDDSSNSTSNGIDDLKEDLQNDDLQIEEGKDYYQMEQEQEQQMTSFDF